MNWLRTMGPVLGLAACAPVAAAQQHSDFRNRVVLSGGVDVVLLGESRVPLIAFRQATLTDHFVAPEIGVSGLAIPGAAVVVASLGVGPVIHGPGGAFAVLVQGGPAVAALVSFYGATTGVAFQYGAGVLIRADDEAAIRLDVTRLVFDRIGGEVPRLWRITFSVAELGRHEARPTSCDR